MLYLRIAGAILAQTSPPPRRQRVRCQMLEANPREAVMPNRTDDARQWRARAEEARDLAQQLSDPESKRVMLGIAVSYVILAQRAEERDASRRKS